MPRLRKDLQFGNIVNDPMAPGDTVLSSAGLSTLPLVTGGDDLLLTLDPSGTAKEIVRVTDHPAASTAATVVRGALGTTAVSHPVGTPWVHGLYTTDVPILCTAATRPASGLTPGVTIYETDTKMTWTWDGAAWSTPKNVSAGLLPGGRSVNPGGALVIGGSEVSLGGAVNVVVPANRWIEVSLFAPAIQSSAIADIIEIYVKEDATEIMRTKAIFPYANGPVPCALQTIRNPTPGPHAYTPFGIRTNGTGTGGLMGTAGSPTMLTVKDVGGRVMDDDELTGCDVGYIGLGVPDEHLPYLALFATVLTIEDYYQRVDAIEHLAAEWRELFA